MATQLTIVNNVLRRLREDTVTSVADNAYSQLIAMFINDGMREVQEAYDWRMLDSSVHFSTVNGQTEYDLSATVDTTGDVVSGGNTTNLDSMLRWDNSTHRPMAFSYDDSNQGEGCQMWLLQDHARGRRQLQDTDQTNEEPVHFSIHQLSDGAGLGASLWPTPNAVKYIVMTFWTPQAELAIDGTDDNTNILVPVAPVEAYAHMTAANERGEEIGEPGNLLERRYTRVLGGAIEAAMTHDGRANRYESWRD